MHDTPRLLFVSHHFPPDISIGSVRSHRIAKEMTARGWTVDVLCAREMYQDGRDDSLMAGLESVRIVRTHALNPRAWARWLRDVARGGDGSNTAPAAVQTESAAVPGRIHQARVWAKAAVAATSSLASTWLEVPDQDAGWLPNAVVAATKLPRPDVVLATIPVQTSALVATAIATHFGVPFVLDYRDPWHARKRRTHLPMLRQQTEIFLEDQCQRRAAALVTVTHGLVEEIGGQNRSAPYLIPNACEPHKLTGITARRFERPTLVYAGSLYGGRSLSPILRSLQRLKSTGLFQTTPLDLCVIGSQSDTVCRDVEALDLSDCVEVLPRQSHAVAMAAALGAAANIVLVAPEHTLQVPAKVFEQIATGRPILALGPAGADVERVLSAHAAARCLTPEDGAGLDAALRDLACGAWRPSTGIPPAYTVEATMDKLNDVLREVAGAHLA